MRTGRLQLGHISPTFEIAILLSCSAIPPLTLRCGLGRTCLFTSITCSTRILASLGKMRHTRPSFPLSRPVMTRTVSLRRRSTRLFALSTVFIFSSRFLSFQLQGFRSAPSKDLGRQGNNLQKLAFAQLAGHWPEDARAHRLAGIVDQHRGVAVKAD